MKQTEEKAITLFKSGLNCAQSVLITYAEKLNFDNRFALNISRGFGGGMGRLQKTCGAVTGAFMVISIYNGEKHSNEGVRKIMTYQMIQDFNSKFLTLYKTSDCRTLLDCDLGTEEGLKNYKSHHLSESVCENCIINSVKLIDELIEE